MATWNERIDNLQARLANLVSEEFAGANFYNTDIGVSDYNPSIDSTVTVTITVTNAEGDPVEDASVTVNASEGQFTKLNNTTITASSSVTGTTNSNGQFTLTYSCTEWGLITFSANTEKLQIKVTGWKTVAQDTWYTLKTNGEFVEFLMFGSHSVNISTSWTTALTIANDTYRPQQNLTGVGYNQTLYQIHTSGEIRIVRVNGSATSTTATGTYYWKLK